MGFIGAYNYGQPYKTGDDEMIGMIGLALLGASEMCYEPGALLVIVEPSCRQMVRTQAPYYDGYVKRIPVDLSALPGLSALLDKYGLTRAERLIPMPITDKAAEYGLDLIFYLHFSNMIDPEAAAEEFAVLPGIMDAQPNYYLPILDTVPNDPRYSQQWHLPKIDAPQGWQIAMGDAVIVGGVDTGVDWDHEDIFGSLWVNDGEDLNHNGVFDNPSDRNGVDDDSNGYVDDIIGFDFSNSDWDPTPNPALNGSDHGTHVYGIMGATTNNAIGVAGVGWKVKGMAFKCDVNCGGSACISIAAATNAVYYAANMGGHVTNHSYGGSTQQTALKAAMQYAYDVKDVNNFAAAGNDNSQSMQYPAGFGYFVTAVAATNESDKKSSYSNYGSWIDVSAPGDAIVSTIPDDQYASFYGTSMASPCAAGVCAVVKSMYPGWSATDIDDAVFHGCVDIDSLNPGYEGKLGWGRVDLYRSLAQTIYCHLLITGISFDIHPDTNNTVKMYPTVANEEYFQDASAITLAFSTADAGVNVTDNQVQISSLPDGDTVTPTGDYFEMTFTGDVRFVDGEITVTSCTPATLDSVFPVRFLVGFPPLVLVDDAEEGVDPYYTEPFDTAGIIYELITAEELGLLRTPERKAVIWFTGADDDPLTPEEMDSIIAYMDEGGCFAISSQYLAEDPDAGHLIYKLGASIDSTDLNVGTIKSVDNEITPGVKYRINGGAGNLESPDKLLPLAEGDSSFIYTTPSGTGDYGIAVVKKNTEFYHSLYFAFPVEAISDGVAGCGNRKELLVAVVNWCDSVSAVSELPPPAALSLAARPNIFRDKLMLSLSVPTKQEVNVTLYDAAGKRVCVLHSGMTEPGVHTITMDSRAISGGVYFLTLNGRLAEKVIRVR